MADNKFFGDKQEEEIKEEKQEEQPETVKIGKKEYTQDELTEIVGLGETAREFETKWNRSIGQFYPEYTQKSQRLAELEKAEEERQRAELDKRAAEDRLTPEEVQKLAIEEAKKIGLITRDEFGEEVNRAVANALAAKQLMDDTTIVIGEAKEKGQPETTVANLWHYMEDNGIRNPEKAYKLMFEDDLDKWKADQLNNIKPPGMETQETTTAGGKTPPPPPTITKDTLSQAIQESLTRGRGV